MNNLYSEFSLQNIKCAGCVNKIENRLGQIDGISEAKVSLLEKTLSVKYTSANLDKQVMAAVKSLGYIATSDKITKAKMNLGVYVVLPILVGLSLMIFGMTNMAMPDYTSFAGVGWGAAQSILSLLIILFTGKSMYKSGINGFLTLNLNMYSLIILGVSAAWIYSTWVIASSYFFHSVELQYVYFESALIIVGLINLGTYLEDKARANTTSAIKSLSALQPDKTTIIKDGQEKVIKTNLLSVGNIVKIRPGERIPADGVVTSGESHIDEAMLTGEPLAVHKKIGDKVIAGSINTTGSFLFEVHGVGDKTVLSEIINLVKSAQMSKPKLAKLADKVAKVFIPAMILIAISTALIWWYFGPEPKVFYAVSTFMTILIIACPCAVGLAVPVALMVGLGRSAIKGVLIRDTSCLSNMDKLDYVLLDKTGTITEGKPTVMAVETATAYTVKDCLTLIKALESGSEHPLSGAILNCQPEIKADMKVSGFTMVSGSGIMGKIKGKTYFVGSKDWIKSKLKMESQRPAGGELNQTCTFERVVLQKKLEFPESSLFINNHFTQVFLADEHNVLARIDISDAIKHDSELAINQLRKNGMKVAMVTGDNQENANYIASHVGLDAVYANCKPEDKINIVKTLQQNHVVAFVGDGINDAPSLVQADVGIAMGGGTDVALQSAGIMLMRSSLVGVNDAITIGRAMNRNMQQNLFGSFIYNIIAVGIAAGTLYPFWHILLNPIIASIAMSLSSITVILNALRLRKA